MAYQRGVDTGDSYLILVMIGQFKKRRLPRALRKTKLLDFEKQIKKQDWEEKLLEAVFGDKIINV